MITIRLLLIVMAIVFFILDGVRLPVSVNLKSFAWACLAGTLLA